jgi:hypothetical protein
MKTLTNSKITEIQFFDNSFERQIDDLCNTETLQEYSANIIIDDEYVVQLSGNKNEAHRVSVPSAAECYWNNEELQDWMCEHFDVDHIESFLDENEIENNFHFLNEY